MKLAAEACHCDDDDDKVGEWTVPGEYHDLKVEPSVEYWETCNPCAFAAITAAMDEIRKYGWEPEIEGVSEFTFNLKTKCYEGGDRLIITCDFTQ